MPFESLAAKRLPLVRVCAYPKGHGEPSLGLPANGDTGCGSLDAGGCGEVPDVPAAQAEDGESVYVAGEEMKRVAWCKKKIKQENL